MIISLPRYFADHPTSLIGPHSFYLQPRPKVFQHVSRPGYDDYFIDTSYLYTTIRTNNSELTTKTNESSRSDTNTGSSGATITGMGNGSGSPSGSGSGIGTGSGSDRGADASIGIGRVADHHGGQSTNVSAGAQRSNALAGYSTTTLAFSIGGLDVVENAPRSALTGDNHVNTSRTPTQWVSLDAPPSIRRAHHVTPTPGWTCCQCKSQNSYHSSGLDANGTPSCLFCPYPKCCDCAERT